MAIFEESGITYEEKDGLFYPNISTETENVNVGKYGLLWMEYMKENAPDRYRSLLRFGRFKKKALEVNEEACIITTDADSLLCGDFLQRNNN